MSLEESRQRQRVLGVTLDAELERLEPWMKRNE